MSIENCCLAVEVTTDSISQRRTEETWCLISYQVIATRVGSAITYIGKISFRDFGEVEECAFQINGDKFVEDIWGFIDSKCL